MQTACVIVIGNEVLSGRTQDKNLAWLAHELNEKGIRLQEARVIADDESAIMDAVNECRRKYTYVFTTGGIGPTHDDITSASIAKAFGVPYERNKEAERILRERYKGEINDARLKMADMPRSAVLIANSETTSPGFRVENVYVFAGVPIIMRAMFDNIRDQLKGGEKMLSKAISAYTTEGLIAQELGAIQDRHPHVDIGSYPFKRDQLGVALIVRGTDALALEAAYQEIKTLLEAVKAEGITEADLAAGAPDNSWAQGMPKKQAGGA